ncbi:uncharacterized protein LOC144443490 [Glandiceps talaboti]
MAETGNGITALDTVQRGSIGQDLERQSSRAPVEKKMGSRSGNSSNTGSVRMKLKKVDEYEAKDAQMNAVFGIAPREVKNTLKMNPLYDQGGVGVIEVSETDAKAASSSKRSRRSSGDKSHRHSYTRDDPDEGETKIAYGRNFMYGKSTEIPNESNGNAVGRQDNPVQLKTQGRVMPSRIKRSSKYPNFEKSNGYHNGEKDGMDDNSTPPNRARRWRLIMLLILVILILALALVLVLYFLTRENES